MIIEKVYDEIISELRTSVKDSEFENKVYAVGGCVRDILSRRPAEDLDLVVELPEGGSKFAEYLDSRGLLISEASVVFPNSKVISVKLKSHPECNIEITHTKKSLNPDKIEEFGTIKEDSLTRDFSINAVYHNISTLRHLDPSTFGIGGIESGSFRGVHENLKQILHDNPIRILRLFNLMRKSFSPVSEVTASASLCMDLLPTIKSKEAVRDELMDLFDYSQYQLFGEFPRVISSFIKLGGLSALLEKKFSVGSFYNPYNANSLRAHIETGLAELLSGRAGRLAEDKRNDRVTLALAIILHDLGRSIILPQDRLPTPEDEEEARKCSLEVAEKFLSDYKFPNEMKEDTLFLIKNQPWLRESVSNGDALRIKKRLLRRAMYEFGKHRWNLLKIFLFIDSVTSRQGHDAVRNPFALLDLSLRCESIFHYKLPITGDEIKELKNIGEGPLVGKYLDFCLGVAFEYPSITKESLKKKLRHLNLEEEESV